MRLPLPSLALALLLGSAALPACTVNYYVTDGQNTRPRGPRPTRADDNDWVYNGGSQPGYGTPAPNTPGPVRATPATPSSTPIRTSPSPTRPPVTEAGGTVKPPVKAPVPTKEPIKTTPVTETGGIKPKPPTGGLTQQPVRETGGVKQPGTSGVVLHETGGFKGPVKTTPAEPGAIKQPAQAGQTGGTRPPVRENGAPVGQAPASGEQPTAGQPAANPGSQPGVVLHETGGFKGPTRTHPREPGSVKNPGTIKQPPVQPTGSLNEAPASAEQPTTPQPGASSGAEQPGNGGVVLHETGGFKGPTRSQPRETGATKAGETGGTRPPVRETGAAVGEAPTKGEQPTGENPVIVFKKTPCLGPCPHFEAQIWANGRVRYVGYRNAPKEGTLELTLPASTVAEILRQADEVRFRKLQDQYLSGATDMPSTFLTIAQPGLPSKTVQVEQGAPDALMSLLTFVDNEINTAVLR
ncbi:DUF6438 domain-containing protein [Hymenobacter sp. B81]|uniref:DUF6438 domain-containing protein n=1 Tax=Hymenobacter sp. B81 TaxID=3344878 RepID=UPI0037DD7B0D